MKIFLGLLLAGSALAMAACTPQPGETVAPSGGSAGSEPPGYCDTVPANPDDLADWNQICSPGRR